MMRILVIEDDARICADITAALEANHYVVDCVRDGEEAWFKGDTEDYAGAIWSAPLEGDRIRRQF